MPWKTISYDSACMGQTVEFLAHIPVGAGPFPVLYLQHGLGDTYEGFKRRSPIAELVENRDLIVILPDAGRGWGCNDPREGGFPWEDHLTCELPDYVDSNLPTLPGPKNQIQAGFSMGGYLAIMYALRHPERFGAAYAMAGSFAFGHQLRPDRPERSEMMLAVAPPGGSHDVFAITKAWEGPAPKIKFDIGRSDHLFEINQKFHAHLDEAGFAHEYEEHEGGHTWEFVGRRLPNVLEFVASIVD